MGKRRGIFFDTGGKWDVHFAHLFGEIDLTQYVWRVFADSMIYRTEQPYSHACGILEDGIYSGTELLERLTAFEYSMLQIVLYAFQKDTKEIREVLKDYEDFVNSDCEIAFLCADNMVELYAKDDGILREVTRCLQSHYGLEPEDITDENDERMGFVV